MPEFIGVELKSDFSSDSEDCIYLLTERDHVFITELIFRDFFEYLEVHLKWNFILDHCLITELILRDFFTYLDTLQPVTEN